MHIHAFEALTPDLEQVAEPDQFFESMREQFQDYHSTGIYQKSPAAMYVYEILKQGKPHLGLLCTVSVADFLEGHIKKHENTIATKEQQQIKLALKRQALVKPVLLAHRNHDSISQALLQHTQEKAPAFEIHLAAQEELHRFWPITSPADWSVLQQLYEQYVSDVYIADGHHRCMAMTLLHQQYPDHPAYRQFLCALFPKSQLDILAFHRVTQGLAPMPASTVLAQLEKWVDVQPLAGAGTPGAKFELVLHFRNQWYLLKWKPELLRQHAHEKVILDAALLEQYIFGEFLGIEDVCTSDQIKYIEAPAGIHAITETIAKSEDRMAWLLYPVALEDMIAQSDQHKFMPPKSTWFEPRMRNGLIVQEL